MPRQASAASCCAIASLFVSFVFGLCSAPVASADSLADLVEQANQDPETLAPDVPRNSHAQEMPSAAARKAAVSKVREVFGDEFSRCSKSAEKIALSSQLTAEADQSRDPAERWALLTESLRLSAEAADIPSAIGLVERLAVDFTGVGPDEKLDALSMLAAKAPSAHASPVLQSMLAVVRDLIDSGKYDLATKALASAAGLARKAKDQNAATEVSELQLTVKELAKERKLIDSFEEKLTKSADDPIICLDAGKFFCFKIEDWAKGLPLLAKGKDADVTVIAQRDLAAKAEPGSIRAVADAWWDWAEEQPTTTREAARRRAASLYEQVVDSVAGLDKTKLEKRIATALTADSGMPSAARGSLPGLVLWLDASVAKSVQTQSGAPSQEARVVRWRDLSGKGHDAAQPAAASQPEWRKPVAARSGAVIFNGKTAISVDMPCEPSGTIVAVVIPATSTANMRTIGCMGKPGEFVGISLRSNGSIWAEASSRGTPAVLCQSPPNSYSPNQSLVVSQTWGKNLRILLNAKQVGPDMTIAPGVPMKAPWGIGGATLGMHVEYFSGEVLEVLVFDRELAANEAAAISTEKMKKWRIR
jgi:hypothetical protein